MAFQILRCKFPCRPPIHHIIDSYYHRVFKDQKETGKSEHAIGGNGIDYWSRPRPSKGCRATVGLLNAHTRIEKLTIYVAAYDAALE